MHFTNYVGETLFILLGCNFHSWKLMRLLTLLASGATVTWRSSLFFWLSSRGPWLVETLTASCSGKHLRQRRRLSRRFDSWLPLRHHLGDKPDSGASLEHLSFSITRCRHHGERAFRATEKRGSSELKFDNELISVPTAANHAEQAFQLSVTGLGLWEWS